MNANTVHQKFGNVFALNLWTPLEEIHTDLVLDQKYVGAAGNKVVNRYKELPSSWDMDGVTWAKGVHIELTEGSFFKPHRDYIHQPNTKWIRLNCFANHAAPHECTYVVDGNIMYFEPTRWYAVNTSLAHWSFCYAPDTVHYVVDIDVSDEYTYNWLIERTSFCDRPKGDAMGTGYK